MKTSKKCFIGCVFFGALGLLTGLGQGWFPWCVFFGMQMFCLAGQFYFSKIEQKERETKFQEALEDG